MKIKTLFIITLLFITACGSAEQGYDEGLLINPASSYAVNNGASQSQSGLTRYIVTFSDFGKSAEILESVAAEVVLSLPRHNSVAVLLPESAINGLLNNPNIESIEEDALRYPTSESTPYGIPMVQAHLIPDHAASGDVTVCIIDSGYYIGQEDLPDTANITFSQDIGTGDATIDGCGHGTHVAGTITAVGGNGLGVTSTNPSGDLNVHIVKVFGNDCSWAYSSSLVKALDECQDHAIGKLVVSMSLGGSVKNRFEENAFDNADHLGVLSIAAAGNDGSSRKSYPASYPSVVSVAAVDQNYEHASFSQFNSSVELSAPGVDVLSTVPWFADSSATIVGQTYDGNAIEFSATTDAPGVTGALFDGGLCDSALSAAGQVVLCERGSVSFYTKVTNAQNGGASAVLIYNSEPGNFLATLGSGNSSSIPALSLSQEDGQSLLSNFGDSTNVVNTFDYPASGYEAWSGTSMATPHVSGVAALVWNNYSNATNDDLREALQNTTLDLGVPGKDNDFGYGLVQAEDALAYLQSGPSCTVTESPEISCDDGIDNDCDTFVDADDSDCDVGGGNPTCDLAQVGEPCTVDGDCCGNKCKGRSGAKTCK